MKSLAPIVLLVAALLILAGIFVRHRDESILYTDNQAAWQAYEEGDRQLQAFRWAQAESLLVHAVTLDPHLAPAQAALGEVLYLVGRSDRMKHHLALADSLTAALDDVRARLLVQVRLSSLRESRFHAHRDSLLDLAVSRAPNDIGVLSGVARRATEAMDVAVAEATWNKVLKLNPNFANAYNYLGYLYLHQGRYAEAENAMRRYAFVAPDLANPHDSLGEVLLTVGRYEEAELELRTAMAKQPDFVHAPMNLAIIHLARGEVPKAIDLIDRVLEVLDGTTLGRGFERQVISRLFFHRLTDHLDAYATRYLAHEPDPRERAFVRVQQLLGRGEAIAALAHLDSLQADHARQAWYPDIPLAAGQVETAFLRMRAIAAEQLGLHDTAVDLLRRSLSIEAGYAPYMRAAERIHLAYNLIPLGDYDEARTQIREALAANPRRAEAVLVAASIEAAEGQIPEALRLLDTLERILARAVDDFPALVDARRLRERLPDPDHI